MFTLSDENVILKRGRCVCTFLGEKIFQRERGKMKGKEGHAYRVLINVL